MSVAVAASAATAAALAGEEPREERVELGQAILWNIDGDRPVLRIGIDFGIHMFSIVAYKYQYSGSNYLSKAWPPAARPANPLLRGARTPRT
jgi:hypothetical protein